MEGSEVTTDPFLFCYLSIPTFSFLVPNGRAGPGRALWALACQGDHPHGGQVWGAWVRAK